MLVYIEGDLVEIGLLHVVIHVGGFGYRVNAPLTTIEKMPKIGSSIKLHLSERIREDQHEIYGFISKNECEFFETLINRVSGVGPKMALNIMSRLSINTLKTAITMRDISLLSKCHGIGKKTAERIIVELSDKINNSVSESSPAQTIDYIHPSVSQDAILALISLGYKPADADKCIRQALAILGESSSAEELIKYALQS